MNYESEEQSSQQQVFQNSLEITESRGEAREMQVEPPLSLNQYAASFNAPDSHVSNRFLNIKNYVNILLQNELLLENIQLKQQIAGKKVNLAKRSSCNPPRKSTQNRHSMDATARRKPNGHSFSANFGGANQ